MELKTGYKQTVVGVIPGQWEVKELGEIGSFSKGKGIRKDEVVADGVPCIRYGEIYTHYNDYARDFFSFIPPGVANKSQRLRKGDLLFAGSGETAEEIGKCVAFLDDKEAYAGGDIVILSQIGQDSMYLGYLMNHQSIATQKARMGQGDAVVHIGARHLRQLQIPLPPIHEQTAIAAALSDVDVLIASLDKFIAKKRDLKQAAMQQLLTGQTRLPGFNGEWEVKRLGEVFSISTGKSKSAHVVSGGRYWVVDMGSVSTDGRLIVSKATNYSGDFLKIGDLAMPKDDIGGGNIIGRVGYIDANATYVLGDHVYCLRAKEGDPLFLSYLVNSYKTNMALRKKVIGSAQLGLGRRSVEEQEIFFPLGTEQTAIAAVLSDMDAELASLEQRLSKTCALKQGMMQELLTGRTRLV